MSEASGDKDDCRLLYHPIASALIDFGWDRNDLRGAGHERKYVYSTLITPNTYFLLIGTKGNPIYFGLI